MAGHRPFKELRDKMLPERRARNEKRAQDTLREMRSIEPRSSSRTTQGELNQGRESVQMPFGEDVGKGWIAEDFDAPLPDELQAFFEGGEETESEPPEQGARRNVD